MRKDLNKILVERERVSSKDHHHNYRHLKKFNPSPGEEGENLPHRESMTFRYGYNHKTFSENLNPLKGAVQAAVGTKWDTFYSELSKTFDKRSVINQHILQHLYQYIETDLYVKNGELYLNDTEHRRYLNRGGRALKDSLAAFYVDPRDGIIKKNKYLKHQRAAARERAARKKKEALEIHRVIDERNVLHKVNDIWYHFTLEELPEGRVVYEKPPGEELFKIIGWDNTAVLKPWDKLSDREKTKMGIKKFVGTTVFDMLTNKHIYKDVGNRVRGRHGYSQKKNMYHATKRSASHKMLKKAGIV